MKPTTCPQCGFHYTTNIVEHVTITEKPSWWPADWVYLGPHHLGVVDRQTCTACNWERETWD